MRLFTEALKQSRFCWAALLDVFYPRICPLSLKRSDRAGTFLTEAVFEALPYLAGNFCEKCGMPCALGLGPCPYCRIFSPYFESARCVCSLEGDARRLIHVLKYKRGAYLSDDFVPLFERLLEVAPLRSNSVLVPIPLSARRFKKRGYNQSECLVRALSKAAGQTPHTVKHLLKRHRDTPTQTALSRARRCHNLKDAFSSASPKKPLNSEQHYYLVDDVITSGTTMLEAGKVLYQLGARRLHAIAVCHSPLLEV